MYRRICFQNDTILCLFMIQFPIAILCACDCFNHTGGSSMHEISVNCLCRISLDALMEQKIHILTIKEFAGEIISAENFTNCKDSLVDVIFTELFNLKHIPKNAFNQLSRLRSLYLSTAPALNSLSLDILENDLTRIQFLRVIRTGIRKVPRMRMHRQIMEMVDFESNSIEIIESNSISVKANQVILDYNAIATVEPWAFNNSEIYKISFKGNLKLTVLSNEAFHGIKSLTVLDLSETSITNIPTSGLKNLEILIIQRTYSLKTIPSIYDFDNLKEAQLTFSFHCCAFNLPNFHNPEKYAQHRARVENMKNICLEYSKVIATTMNRTNNHGHDFENLSDDEEWHGRRKRRSQSVLELQNKTLVAYCGTVRYKEMRVQCVPVPNAFNPCEDIMGYKWLRYCVWFVALTGLFGNACVLMVILSKAAEMTVQNLLICNLAFSDSCMAIFLLMVAIVDLISAGVYFNFAYDWQRGMGCKIAGFVTIFSCQLSIFVLCLLTVERWFTIKRALYVNRLTFRITALITGVGWVHAIVMATLPLLGISSYSTTSLCLPMKTETAADTAYILFLLFSAFAAFITMCFCYFQIYFSLSYETRHKDGEYVLARKMAILVATNFLCWAPITFFALTAVLGFPLINITNSKILLVFFYPLNSCANPFLYAILTTNFKRDFIYLLAKFGICKKKARQYKLIFYQPRGNSKHPIQRPFTSQTSL